MFLAAGAIVLLAAGLALYVHRLPEGTDPQTTADGPPSPSAEATPRPSGASPATPRVPGVSPFAVGTPGRPTALVEQVQQEATEAVARQRVELARRCFPSGGEPTEFRLHLSFDAGGREIARSVVAPRKGLQPAVNCLTRVTDLPVQVSGTGAPSSAVVTLRVP